MIFRKLSSVLKETVKEWRKDNTSVLGGSLAFYIIISIGPLLIVLLTLTSTIFSEEFIKSELIFEVRQNVGEREAKFLENILIGTTYSRSDILLWSLLLFGGATTAFVHLKHTLNRLWGIKPKRKFVKRIIRDRIVSAFVIIIMGFMIVFVLGASIFLSVIRSVIIVDNYFFWYFIDMAFSFVSLTFLLSVLYKVLPDAHITWKDTLIGSSITSLFFIIGNEFIGYYITFTSITTPYNFTTSFVVISLWIYILSQIFLFGAEFTQVYSRRYGSSIKTR